MTIQEARNHSQKLILKSTAFILLILFLLLLLGQTQEGFSNGVVFFLKGIFNFYSILGLILLFSLSAFLAKKAGENIIIEKQSVILVAAKYSILISLFVTVYVTIAAVFNRDLYSTAEISSLVTTSFLPMFLKTLLFIFLVWFWAGTRLKKKV